MVTPLFQELEYMAILILVPNCTTFLQLVIKDGADGVPTFTEEKQTVLHQV